MKKCSKCQVEKDEVEFHKDKHKKDGLVSQCKQCRIPALKVSVKRIKDQPKNIPNEKKCSVCQQIKNKEMFWKDNHNTDGLCSCCIQCKKGKVGTKIITEQTCPHCKKTKQISEFYKSQTTLSGFMFECKVCTCSRSKDFRQTENGKISLRKGSKKWSKKKRATDPVFRLRNIVSRAVYQALQKNCSSKRGKSIMSFLPYTIQELKKHLEEQWENWMSWENYGPYRKNKTTWQIDHIFPQSYLPYDTMEHPNFLKCWKLENLQPLGALENIRKKDQLPSWLIENEDGVEEL